jgi:hypothetical protein
MFPALELTEDQIKAIKPLLDLEFQGGRPRLLLGQVRRKPYAPEDDKEGVYQIAFALIEYDTAVKVLDIIDGSAKTRYAPDGHKKVKEPKRKALPAPVLA